jgi:uncharacterized membrane protein YdfJ with MMPL/SSD domain
MKEKKHRSDRIPNGNKKGMGTVEIVIIIAILVALALVFRGALTNYADNIMDFVFDDANVIGALN